MRPSCPGAATESLRVLVVHGELPLHDRHSGSLRLFRILELMAEAGHRVTFVARAGLGQERYTAELTALGIDVHPLDPERLRERGPALALPDLDLAGLLERERFDVAFLSFYEIAEQYLPLIRQHSPLTRVVVDTVDVHYVRERRGAELAGDAAALAAAERTRLREQAVYGAADGLVAVSDDDAAALRELTPEVPVWVVSNIHDEEPEGPAFAERAGVVFVGNFGHAPNVDAIFDFHAHVWPLVRAALPGAELTIVGTDPPPAVTALAGDGVEVTGWVEAVVPYLHRARVSIAPLRYGAGVKGKIGEAMSHGLPVVTTAIGAEGMDLVDGSNALVADGHRAFADAVVRLHSDETLWRRLSASGREHIEQRLGRTAARAALDALLRRTRFVVTDPQDLDAALASYVGAFEPDEPVSLVVAVPTGDVEAPQRAYAAAGAVLERLGLDAASVPDISIALCPPDAPRPDDAVLVRSGDPGDGRRSIEPAAPSAVWRGFLDAPARPRATRPVPRASIVLGTPHDADALAPQLAAIERAELPADVELVVAAGAADAATEDLLRRAGARVVRSPLALGRRAGWQLAAMAARGRHVVALSPLAIPRPGFLEPLLASLDDGAALAAPVVAGAHGLRVAADGSLWPRAADDPHALGALALDCLAAPRELIAGGLPELPSGEGHAEAQFAAWARERGGLRVAADSFVDRLSAGEASVIVCTRNRADELPDCVALLLAAGAADVVIVDNASTDETGAVAERLAAASDGRVRVVFEGRPGLCHARNAGADAARHDLLLYVDDDARPAPGWLEHMTWALTRPGVVNAGGPICALWPQERPAGWPGRDLEPLLSVLDLGDVDRDLAPPDVVYGANWAVRRDALRSVGGFDPAFGPSDRARINGDEVSVAWRLHQAGLGTTRYAFAGAVGHRITPARVDDGFLRHRSMCVGVERPRHAVALGGPDGERLVSDATRAAGRLRSLMPVAGQATVEDVLERIGGGSLPLVLQIQAADALGELAACAALLGETEVAVDELELRISPEDVLLGRLARPLAAAA